MSPRIASFSGRFRLMVVWSYGQYWIVCWHRENMFKYTHTNRITGDNNSQRYKREKEEKIHRSDREREEKRKSIIPRNVSYQMMMNARSTSTTSFKSSTQRQCCVFMTPMDNTFTRIETKLYNRQCIYTRLAYTDLVSDHHPHHN